jgi:hypothetical protein
MDLVASRIRLEFKHGRKLRWFKVIYKISKLNFVGLVNVEYYFFGFGLFLFIFIFFGKLKWF